MLSNKFKQKTKGNIPNYFNFQCKPKTKGIAEIISQHIKIKENKVCKCVPMLYTFMLDVIKAAYSFLSFNFVFCKNL